MIAIEFMTLDGVVQGPSSPDEDRSGRFEHGGWHAPHSRDETFMRVLIAAITGAGGFLLGRGTYEIFAAHWPNASSDEQVIAEPFSRKPKYVASTTLTAPLEWTGSTLLEGDVAETVAALKREDGGDLLAIGSPELVRTLLTHNLVDELRLMIDPVVVGGGKRLFADDGVLRNLSLAESTVTTTGAIMCTYLPREGRA
ncbi:MAG: dihydrofolate reductase family protein [bacterium]